MKTTILTQAGALGAAMLLLIATALTVDATDESFHTGAVEKQTTTLSKLSPKLRASAIAAARSMSDAPTFQAVGRAPQAGLSDAELDGICGEDWFIVWEEDADGTPKLGTFELYCGGAVVPLP